MIVTPYIDPIEKRKDCIASSQGFRAVRPLYERCKKLPGLGKSFRVCTDQAEDGGTKSWTNPKAQTGYMHSCLLYSDVHDT